MNNNLTVGDLISMLQALPQDLEVRFWDEAEDDYVHVTDVVQEEGCPYVDLVSEKETA